MNTSAPNTNTGSPGAIRPEPGTGSSEPGSSDGSSPTSQDVPDRQPLSEVEKADRVAELMGLQGGDAPPRRPGDVPDDGPDDGRGEPPEDDGDQPAGARGSDPGTIKDLAERLQESPEALYALKVNTGDGETVTLGDLKDAWQGRRGAERELEERAAQLDQRETAQLADQQLWGQLAAELQDHLPDGTRAAISERMEARSETFRRGILEAMPELADPVAKEAFEGQIVEALKPYGVKPSEIAPFFTDHRAVVFMRDAIRAKQRLDKLLSYRPDQAPPKGGRSSGRDPGKGDRQNAQRVARAAKGSEAQKVDAVTSLIRGR